MLVILKKSKGRLQKRLVKGIKIFLEKKTKKKTKNMLEHNTVQLVLALSKILYFSLPHRFVHEATVNLIESF